MWGGIMQSCFQLTILSYENPIRNGFSRSMAESYTKYTWSDVEFQNKIVGKEIQYSFYEQKKFGPLKEGDRFL